MSTFRSTILFTASLGLTAACNATAVPPTDSGIDTIVRDSAVDSRVDTNPQTDATLDAPPSDASGDAASGDAATDARVDAGSDANMDAALDAPPSDSGFADTATTDSGPITTDSGPTDGGVPDAAGSVMPQVAGQLIITEVMHNPGATATDADGEWFEIYNPSNGVTYNLMGCVLGEGNAANMPSINSAVLVAPGDYVVIASAGNIGITPDYSYDGAGELQLNNGGDFVSITCGGTLIDRADFEANFTNPATFGRSSQLPPNMLNASANDSTAVWCPPNDAAVFWTNGAATDSGTPGMPNVCAPN